MLIKGEVLQELIMGMSKNNKLNNLYFALFPFINVDIFNAPTNISGFTKIVFGLLIFNIILLYCIVNIVAYFGIIYIIEHTDLEQKYPKFRPIIKYYKNTSIIFLIIEIIFVILYILVNIGVCLHLLYLSNVI
jgi:hypothetical protein